MAYAFDMYWPVRHLLSTFDSSGLRRRNSAGPLGMRTLDGVLSIIATFDKKGLARHWILLDVANAPPAARLAIRTKRRSITSTCADAWERSYYIGRNCNRVS
jgi:hypothetical protein